MKITAIKAQLKNSDRVSVFIDNKFKFSLSLNELISAQLKSGMDVDDKAVSDLQKLSVDGKLKNRALEWLLIRPHSISEFKSYLWRKKIDKELADLWSAQFQEKGYLDDEAFAKWWIDNRRRSKKASSRKLNLELRQKGVDGQIITKLLDDNLDEENQALRGIIEKKRRLPRFSIDDKKLTEYLLRQGFNYSDIKQILSNSDI